MEAGATVRKSPSPSRETAGAPEFPTDVPSADTVHSPAGRPVCHLGATSICGDGTCHFLQVSPRRTPEWVTLDQGAQEKQPAACRYGHPGCWGPGPALPAPCGRSRAPHQAQPSVRGDAGFGCLRQSPCRPPHCWTEWGLHTDAQPALTPRAEPQASAAEEQVGPATPVHRPTAVALRGGISHKHETGSRLTPDSGGQAPADLGLPALPPSEGPAGVAWKASCQRGLCRDS